MCNERPGTLTSQEGLVSLLGAKRRKMLLRLFLLLGSALRAAMRVLRNWLVVLLTAITDEKPTSITSLCAGHAKSRSGVADRNRTIMLGDRSLEMAGDKPGVQLLPQHRAYFQVPTADCLGPARNKFRDDVSNSCPPVRRYSEGRLRTRPKTNAGEKTMTQYLVAIQHPDNYDPSLEGEAMERDIAVLNEEMDAAGVRIFAGGLSPASSAKSLRAQPDGKVLITDGPYLETKEHVGGFWLLEAVDLDEALAWGRKAAVACRVPVEVRAFLRVRPHGASGRDVRQRFRDSVRGGLEEADEGK